MRGESEPEMSEGEGPRVRKNMSDIYQSEDDYKKADYYDACDTETLEHDFEHEAILAWCDQSNVKSLTDFRDKTCVIVAYSLSGQNPREAGKRTLSGIDLERLVGELLFKKRFGASE